MSAMYDFSDAQSRTTQPQSQNLHVATRNPGKNSEPLVLQPAIVSTHEA